MKQTNLSSLYVSQNWIAITLTICAVGLLSVGFLLLVMTIEAAVDMALSEENSFSFFIDDVDQAETSVIDSTDSSSLNFTLDHEYAERYRDGANAPPTVSDLNFTLDFDYADRYRNLVKPNVSPLAK